MADIFEANRLVGDAVNPYQQTYADTCAIKSQQIILNEFGIQLRKTNWCSILMKKDGIMVMDQVQRFKI